MISLINPVIFKSKWAFLHRGGGKHRYGCRILRINLIFKVDLLAELVLKDYLIFLKIWYDDVESRLSGLRG